ncbi:Hypothetical protein PBC10988_2200 [Planctomycetales bacterium 10988]|nr:Hypothetical protein PBC10988_2200 [Planctomycetales bacterium 10988]
MERAYLNWNVSLVGVLLILTLTGCCNLGVQPIDSVYCAPMNPCATLNPCAPIDPCNPCNPNMVISPVPRAPQTTVPATSVPPAALPTRAPVVNNLAVSPSIQVCPKRIVAPVGSEVILVSSVDSGRGNYLAGERVEWILSQGGVGEFVSFGQNDWTFHTQRKYNNQYIVGQTSTRTHVLNRGTATRSDDVQVLRGQAWASVTSAVEGTSYVTVYTPASPSWDLRKDTATIHWVDAEFRFPPPVVQPSGGRATLTTVVTRMSDHAPLEGWIVRYQILDGPPAQFASNSGQAVEVRTDSTGQATAEIVQASSQGGTNRIGIQILRPANAALGQTTTFATGNGATMVTWTAPGLGFQMSGPAQAAENVAIPYQLVISNTGGAEAANVRVFDDLPADIEFQSSEPPPSQTLGKQLEWNLGTIQSGEQRQILLNVIARRGGTFNHCATAQAAGALSAQDCVTTSIGSASVDVQVTGPQAAQIGETASFEITLTNRGSAPASDLIIKDTYDRGLQHSLGSGVIERRIGQIGPGQSFTTKVDFGVVAAGRQCQQVEILSNGNVLASTNYCITVTQPPPPATPQPRPQPEPKPEPEPEPQLPAQLNGQIEGLENMEVGDRALVNFTVTNRGRGPARAVRLVVTYNPQVLNPLDASAGSSLGNGSLSWLIDEIEPNKGYAVQIRFEAIAPANRTCTELVLTEAGGQTAQQQACVRISGETNTPPPAGEASLRISVSDYASDAPPNSIVSYQIDLFNDGDGNATQVQVVVEIPQGMSFFGVGRLNPTEYQVQGQQIIFDPIEILEPGNQQYVIQLRAPNQEGTVRVNASLSADGLQRPLSDFEETEILNR